MVEIVAYTGADIKVLEPHDVVERFPFAKIAALCERYPQSTQDFIRRLVLACNTVGFDVELAAKRYLDGDRTVVIPHEVYAAHAELMREDRGWR